MKIYKMEQQTEEWFEVKKGKFSASDAKTIKVNGKGLETLAYKKAAEILADYEFDEGYTNLDMERGNELENTARLSYEIDTNNMVETVGFVEASEYVGCSPDGLVGEEGLVEIKCPRSYKFLRLKHTQEIKEDYYWQMQMQMYVTDRKWCDYVAFHSGFKEPVIIRVERDPSDIKKIEAGLKSGIKLLEKIIDETRDN